MVFKMYLLNISDLEDKGLQETALTLLDSRRKEIAQRYKKEKDRMRAIAAGLLLQLGFLEAELPSNVCFQIGSPKGLCYVLKAGECIDFLIKKSESESKKLPIEVVYEYSEHGKPFWNKAMLEAEYRFKKLWQFNLSHSGDYVVLVAADQEVGIDIQEPRRTKHVEGGYRAFSRMEAYVKCTGEGYAKGIGAYKECSGEIPGYYFMELNLIEEYACHLCFCRRI